jgi:hypothetical protein
MTDPLPPALLPLAGGTDAASPGAALERLMALPACPALRGWQEPHRAIAIRATARRLAAGAHADWALWGAACSKPPTTTSTATTRRGADRGQAAAKRASARRSTSAAAPGASAGRQRRNTALTTVDRDAPGTRPGHVARGRSDPPALILRQPHVALDVPRSRRSRIRRVQPVIEVDVDHHGRPGRPLRDPVLRNVALPAGVAAPTA